MLDVMMEKEEVGLSEFLSAAKLFLKDHADHAADVDNPAGR